jgi:hypothetical protein
MMLTEQEAKGKVCPQAIARAAIPYPGSGSVAQAQQYGYPSSALNCVASDCMAWRWAPRRTEMVSTPDQFFPADEKQTIKMVPNMPEGDNWTLVGPVEGAPGWSNWRRAVPTDLGFCGLAEVTRK